MFAEGFSASADGVEPAAYWAYIGDGYGEEVQDHVGDRLLAGSLSFHIFLILEPPWALSTIVNKVYLQFCTLQTPNSKPPRKCSALASFSARSYVPRR